MRPRLVVAAVAAVLAVLGVAAVTAWGMWRSKNPHSHASGVWPACLHQQVPVHVMGAPFVESLLKDRWNVKAHEQGVMAAVPKHLSIRTLQTAHGPYNLVHNPVRSHKRKTKQSLQLENVRLQRPFDPRDFHFGRAPLKEFLFLITDNQYVPQECMGADDIHAFPKPIHAVLVNKYPLSKFSGLLVPFLREHRSQVLTADALVMGLNFAQELQGSGLRVGFNSLHAGASVNHLHFQFWHCQPALPIELFDMRVVKATARVLIERDTGYLSRFLRFTFQADGIGSAVEAIMPAVQHLTRTNTPYNLIIVPGMVYLLPRQPMQQQLGSINVGFPEIAGCAVVPSRRDFKTLSPRDVEQHWESNVRISKRAFEELVDVVANEAVA